MGKHVLGLLTKSRKAEETLVFCKYYQKIGFDHIVIWDNDSPAELDFLKDYPWVEVRKVSGWPNQNKIFTDFSKEMAGKCEWVYLTDDDEFLYLQSYENIKQVTESFSNYEGVSFNMVNMGYQNPVERRSRHFVLDCVYRWDYDHPVSRNIKTIVRPESVIKYPQTHLPLGPRVVNMERKPVSRPLEDFVCFNRAWVLHYVWQSWEDYCAKSERGLAATGGHRKMLTREEFNRMGETHFVNLFTEFREYFNQHLRSDLV